MGDMFIGPSPLPPADYIAETRRLYDSLGYEPYRWAERPEPPPWAPIDRPLAECRVAVIASGGIYRAGQVAFHHRDDTSIRIIDRDTPTAELRATHFAYDLTDARADPNCVFPIDTLRDLAADGMIGELAGELYTFMGGIYSTRKVDEIVAPQLVDLVGGQHPDIVLLVPV
jgi:D-proline reductase (dithiol) PrdB